MLIYVCSLSLLYLALNELVGANTPNYKKQHISIESASSGNTRARSLAEVFIPQQHLKSTACIFVFPWAYWFPFGMRFHASREIISVFSMTQLSLKAFNESPAAALRAVICKGKYESKGTVHLGNAQLKYTPFIVLP